MRKLAPFLLLVALLVAGLVGTAFSPAFSSSAPKNLGRAIDVQRALVADQPADSAAQNDLGSLLLLANDLPGAEEAYRKAIALDSENAAAHFNLGLLLQRQEDRRGALKEFKRTSELEPRNAWAHYQAGTIYAHWGLETPARKAYAKALALDPSLGNPEVNPHLLDNELATSAMLYSYHHYREELQPEKRFEEPARIAGVLIDRPQADGDAVAQEPTSGAAAGEGGFVRGSGTPAEGQAGTQEAAKPEPPEGDDNPSRVLTSKDLDPARATNQVGGGAGPSVIGVAGSAGGRVTSSNRARTRDPRAPTTPPVRPTLRGPQSAPPLAPPPTTFLPTGDSTGQMETRLVEIDEMS